MFFGWIVHREKLFESKLPDLLVMIYPRLYCCRKAVFGFLNYVNIHISVPLADKQMQRLFFFCCVIEALHELLTFSMIKLSSIAFSNGIFKPMCA